jgi:hypothetical protein
VSSSRAAREGSVKPTLASWAVALPRLTVTDAQTSGTASLLR